MQKVCKKMGERRINCPDVIRYIIPRLLHSCFSELGLILFPLKTTWGTATSFCERSFQAWDTTQFLYTSPPSADIWHESMYLLASGKCVNKILILNFFTKLCSWLLCVYLFQLMHVNKSFYLQLTSTYKSWLSYRFIQIWTLFQSFLQNYCLSAYVWVLN